HATTFTPVVVVVPLRHRVSEAGKGQEPLSGVVISPGHNAAMSLPRVIAIDLDGTLLDNNSAVTDRSRRALTMATEAGVRVVIVTGRPPRDTDAIAALFDCAAVVCANGAHIRVPGQDTLTREFDRDNAEEVLKVLRGSARSGVRCGHRHRVLPRHRLRTTPSGLGVTSRCGWGAG